MRILWLSNAPWAPSGYGEQSQLFIPRIRDLGHDLAAVANYGLNGVKLEWDGLTVYPTDNAWGNLNTPVHAAHCGADLVIALCDAWVLHPETWPPGFRMAVWAPVDHEPMPPAVDNVLAHQSVFPVAMSRFGERMMRNAGLDPVYVPHGVDPGMFRPDPDMRATVRDDIGVPEGAFVVGMVAANKGNPACPRKAFPQAFDAFARFAADHDDAYLFVHSQADPEPGSGGLNLVQLAEAVGCQMSKVRFTPRTAWQTGVPREAVAAVYQAFDVLLSPSMGEGFGIPILEAQACGVPVIVSDHSAMAELGENGWRVGGDRWWDALQGAFLHVPSIPAIHASLEDAYVRRGDQGLRDRAVAFAGLYEADTVTETYWKPALGRLTEWAAVKPADSNGSLNRQQRRQLARAGR